MAAPDILAALHPIADALDALGVRWYICGSVASSALGVARATLDIDIVADLGMQQGIDLARRLEGDYYVSENLVRDAVTRRSSFNVVHLATMLKVDVFMLKPRDYDQQAFGRARADTLEPHANARQFLLPTGEDTILSKLEWYRLGDEVSERQWNDVLGVMRVQAGKLDLDYLRQWAATLGLTDLLDRALRESED